MDRKKQSAEAMREALWKDFLETGRVDAYLHYRKCRACGQEPEGK